MYVCVYLHMYVCMYVGRGAVYSPLNAYMHVCACVYMYVCIYVCVCVCRTGLWEEVLYIHR